MRGGKAVVEQKLDLRVQKTHRALLNALYDLLCEKCFDKITVTELCERAETRKATFYKHFADKNELLVYMIKEMQRKSKEENAIEYNPEKPESYYIGIFRFFLNFLDENVLFVQRVLASSARSAVLDILSEQIEADLKEHLKETWSSAGKQSWDIEFLASLYTGAMVYCGSWWASQLERPDKEAVVARFARMIERLCNMPLSDMSF